MTVSLRDSDGTTRLEGDLLASGGATGDVLTQQADGTYAAAPGGSQPILTTPVSLTAAELLAISSQFQLLVAGTPGTVVVPLALFVATAASGSGGYNVTDVPYLTPGSGSQAVGGLSAALESGLNQIGVDVLPWSIGFPAGDVIEGGLAITADSDPAASGGTPDWGITGTLYYIEFTP